MSGRRTAPSRCPSRRRLGSAGAIAAALVALPLWAPAGAAEPEPAEAPQQAEGGLIRISDGALHPEVHRVAPGDDVAWSNEDAHLAVISFRDDLAEALACGDEDVRPTFHADGRGRLLSEPIRSLPFTLPCPLPPGSHPYRVHLLHQEAPPGSPIGSPAPIENADETLEGTLVFEAAGDGG